MSPSKLRNGWSVVTVHDVSVVRVEVGIAVAITVVGVGTGELVSMGRLPGIKV